MRYHFEKPTTYSSMYGTTYICNHPIYDKCTLFKIGHRGLAVVQQRFDTDAKRTWWSEIDPWLNDSLYLHPNFKEYFDERSGPDMDGLYPTVSIRQMMWALKIKPLPKERWETTFDRRCI